MQNDAMKGNTNNLAETQNKQISWDIPWKNSIEPKHEE